MPENINEILLTIHNRKHRKEILQSVKAMTNYEEKMRRTKSSQQEMQRFNQQQQGMALELKKQLEVEEQAGQVYEKDNVRYLADQKRTKKDQEPLNDVLMQGRKAASENCTVQQWRKKDAQKRH